MTGAIPQTSMYFCANLGVLDVAAVQAFSIWASANCSQHILREEDGSTVLHAKRASSRTEQQHKNTLKALASNRKIKWKTEASFLRLLGPEEYEAIVREALPVVGQTEAPGPREDAPPMCCKMETIMQLPDNFDFQAGEMYAQLVASRAR